MRVLIGKTTKELEDLHGAANSIFQVLDDAHQELTQLQRSTKTLVSEASVERERREPGAASRGGARHRRGPTLLPRR
ncbi:hypothetical protein ACFCWG_05230 [Streptomyces sp. NPDC056390]|uniref:hypothetical protein n=1 Tax=Streptomyces sp. NPDC056390 TaxID=3345806 RepID=UPI0035E3A043